MFHLASGNKNKKKLIKLPNGKGAGNKGGKKIYFDRPAEQVEEEMMSVDAVELEGNQWPVRKEKKSSPAWSPPSPKQYPVIASDSKSVDTPSSKTVKRKKNKSVNGNVRGTQPRAPSERSDLPLNVKVTKVDVESKGWEAGVGEIIEGTSSEWEGWSKSALPSIVAANALIPEVEMITQTHTPSNEEDDEWSRWPDRIQAEYSWKSLKQLSRAEAKDGQRVATQVSDLTCHVVCH